MRYISHHKFRDFLSQDEIELNDDIYVGKWYDPVFSKVKLHILDNCDPYYKDTFTGELNGNGFAIYNIKKPLFESIEGTVKNITIKSSKKFKKSILCEENRGLIDNVTVDCKLNVKNPSNRGGFVRKNAGTISNSTFTGAMKIYENVTASSVGGICGINKDLIKNCSVKNVYIRGLTIIGGIAGLNNGRVKESQLIESNIYSFMGKSGGITGINNNIITRCIVDNSNIEHRQHNTYKSENIGGISGVAKENSTIKESEIKNNCLVEGDKNIGGIVGKNSGVVKRSVCNMKIQVSGEKQIGGIVGRNSSGTLSNIVSKCRVYGECNFIGGLVGTLTGESLVTDSISEAIVDCDPTKTQCGTVFGTVDTNTSDMKNCHYTGKQQDAKLVGNTHINTVYNSARLSKKEVRSLVAI